MAAIVLTTINARYIHASLGLRWLYANLGELQPLACIQEYSLTDQVADIAEKTLAAEPMIVGIGVYIWNAAEVRRLIGMLKRVAPGVCIVLGQQILYCSVLQSVRCMCCTGDDLR